MNKKIRGKLLALLLAVVLCTGCNSGKNKPEDVTVVTGSEENIVYQPSFVQLSCEMGKEDAVPPRAFSHIFVNEKAVYGVAEHSDDMTHTRSNYVVIKDIEGDGYTDMICHFVCLFIFSGTKVLRYKNCTCGCYAAAKTVKDILKW